ncbi:MAG: HAMP domain-containing sensor histidine kinase [Bacteroidota bacterium]
MRFKFLLYRLSRKNSFLLVVFSAIAFIWMYQLGSSYFLALKAGKKAVLQRLEILANSASIQLNGDAHEALTEKYGDRDDIIYNTQDCTYHALHSVLKLLVQKNKISTPIYTMVYNGRMDNYEFIVSSSDQPYFRHTFTKYPKELRMDYLTGGIVDVYKSENGTWLSAFQPIKNSKGDVVAVVQCDEKFDDFIEEARMALFIKIGIALVMFLPFSFFLYRYIRRNLERQDFQKHLLREKNQEIQAQSEVIKRSHDRLEEANRSIQKRNESLDQLVNERTKELINANKDLQTFLYRSSHDIQGPIATLKGLFKLAEVDSENTQVYVQKIAHAVNQLDLRIRGINSVFEIRDSSVTKENIELENFVSSIASTEAEYLDCQGYTCQFDLDDNVNVTSDKEMLTVIFRELINNSLVYNNDNHVEIKITARKKGLQHLDVVFEDNGVGIKEEIQSSIFTMFKRGNESSQGSGLGLYAVNMALKKLHGLIRLLPRKQGAAFQIILPSI